MARIRFYPEDTSLTSETRLITPDGHVTVGNLTTQISQSISGEGDINVLGLSPGALTLGDLSGGGNLTESTLFQTTINIEDAALDFAEDGISTVVYRDSVGRGFIEISSNVNGGIFSYRPTSLVGRPFTTTNPADSNDTFTGTFGIFQGVELTPTNTDVTGVTYKWSVTGTALASLPVLDPASFTTSSLFNHDIAISGVVEQAQTLVGGDLLMGALLRFSALPVEAADDTAAEAAGVGVGYVYRTGSTLKIRIT